MNILNVFTQDAFGTVALTAAVNDITPTYNRLGALGIFKPEGVNTRTVAVDFDPVTNSLLPSSAWGGPGVANKSKTAYTKSFNISHFPVHDQVLAADLISRRRPGSSDVVDAQYFTGKKMSEMRQKLEQTREWMRLGALKGGLVKDGNGTTLLDIYGDFGLTQDSTSFVLGTATTDVMGLIAARKRAIIQALRGENITGFIGLCSDDFYDAFVKHANVKVAFTYYQNNGQNLATDYSGGSALASNVRGFVFGGGELPVVWINYTGAVVDASGTSQTLIDSGSAYIIPTGTSVFKEFLAPADYMETVNTEGVDYYAKTKMLDYDKGVEIECQSNPLPICLKPKVIQKVTIS